jgi:xylose isomerase
MSDAYTPRPEHKFSFGLWTVANRGRDPFGTEVRPVLDPVDAVALLAEVGAWGVNLHDNDLVPIDATPAERDRIVSDFKKACERNGIVVPMATVSLFTDPVFKDGAFTANDPAVRAYAVQKTMRAMDLGAELGAKIFVLWGGREGTETDACRRPDDAVKRLREAIDFLCEYSIDKGYGYRFALEAKPNEPRGDIYMATTGNYLGLIPTLAHPEMVGVNPEVAHETMAGLNFTHAVAQAWEAGKLFHIDLNDQVIGRYDQDFRFGAANPKNAFFLRGREGLRARLHADVPHPQGEGRPLERGPRDPGARQGSARSGSGGAVVREVLARRTRRGAQRSARPREARRARQEVRAARPADDRDPARRPLIDSRARPSIPVRSQPGLRTGILHSVPCVGYHPPRGSAHP